MKFCSGCMKNKPLEEFHYSAFTKDNKQSNCITCRQLHRRSTYFYDKYGINMDDYIKLCEKQNNKCAICNDLPSGKHNQRVLHIDHDYKTGKVRGLLCSPCNLALGGFKDSIEVLESAIEYLKRSKPERKLTSVSDIKKQDG